eukprot:1145222-Pelagomonas_calceolata.AAC.7
MSESQQHQSVQHMGRKNPFLPPLTSSAKRGAAAPPPTTEEDCVSHHHEHQQLERQVVQQQQQQQQQQQEQQQQKIKEHHQIIQQQQNQQQNQQQAHGRVVHPGSRHATHGPSSLQEQGMHVRVHVVTFNMAGTLPDVGLPASLFKCTDHEAPDM